MLASGSVDYAAPILAQCHSMLRPITVVDDRFPFLRQNSGRLVWPPQVALHPGTGTTGATHHEGERNAISKLIVGWAGPFETVDVLIRAAAQRHVCPCYCQPQIPRGCDSTYSAQSYCVHQVHLRQRLTHGTARVHWMNRQVNADALWHVYLQPIDNAIGAHYDGSGSPGSMTQHSFGLDPTPRPVAPMIERLTPRAPCNLAQTRNTRCVVGQSGTIPVERWRYVRCGSEIHQHRPIPPDREMQQIRVPVATGAAATLDTHVAFGTCSEHGNTGTGQQCRSAAPQVGWCLRGLRLHPTKCFPTQQPSLQSLSWPVLLLFRQLTQTAVLSLGRAE